MVQFGIQLGASSYPVSGPAAERQYVRCLDPVHIRCFAFVSSLLLGCSTPFTLVNLDLQIIDHPSEQRVEVVYLNGAAKAICISDGDWPNEGGRLDQMGGVAFLVVGTEKFSIRDFNMGYTPSKEIFRVSPGETLSGSIPYSEFDLPEHLQSDPKSLDYPLSGWTCR